MQRLRFYDLRTSTLPDAVGLCEADIPNLAAYVNSAQRRLLMCKEAGDEGWWGTWAEMAFTVSMTAPYLTCPREVARIQFAAVCTMPVDIQNQFYEYLQFGNGRLPKYYRTCQPNIQAGYMRNNVPTFVDLSNAPQIIRFVMLDPADAGKRVLLQGTDLNDKPLLSIDTYNPTNGIFVTLADPFVDAPVQVNTITGIQKDKTVGQVEVHQIDPSSGADVLLLTMQPSETTASYRRYYFDSLPSSCCPPAGAVDCTNPTVNNLQLTVIAKLDLIPVQVDTDYCLIQNPEAIIEECQAIRYSRMDSSESKAMARNHHLQAISYLNGELCHFLGKDKPAVSFKPFGSASLDRVYVGNLF